MNPTILHGLFWGTDKFLKDPLSSPLLLLASESDLDSLRSFDLVAATPCGDWSPQHIEALRGFQRIIVIAPENEVARARCREFIESLTGVVPEVYSAEVPNPSVETWAMFMYDGNDVLRSINEISKLESPPEPPLGAETPREESQDFSETISEPEATSQPPADREASSQRPTLLDVIQKTPTLSDKVYERIPQFLRKLTDLFDDPRERDVFLLASIGVLSSMLPKYRGRYFNSDLSPNLFLFVAAPPASGKSALGMTRRLAEPVEAILELEYQEALAAWKEAQKQEGGSDDPEPVRKRLIIPGNASSAAIMEALSNNDGFGLIIEVEADSLAQTLAKDWGTFSDVLRAGFHNEPATNLRLLAERIVKRVTLSVVISGTPRQLQSLIPHVENGLFSRFMLYCFVSPDYDKWRDPRPREGPDPLKLLKAESERLVTMYVALRRNKGLRFVMSDAQWDRFNQHLEGLKRRLAEAFSYDGAGVANRIGVQAFKITMVLSALRTWEEKGGAFVETGPIEATDDDLEAALGIIDCLAQHVEAVLTTMPLQGGKESEVASKRELLERLPDEFQRREANALAEQVGLSERSVNDCLRDWVKEGIVERVKKGYFRKKRRPTS
jgi:hypothetical protein